MNKRYRKGYGTRLAGQGIRLAGGRLTSSQRSARRARIGTFLGNANKFLRKHKTLSHGAASFGKLYAPFAPQATRLSGMLSKVGYGRKRACVKRCRRRMH